MLWSQKEFSLISSFRVRLWNDFPETKTMDSINALTHIMKRCKILWDREGKFMPKSERDEILSKQKAFGCIIQNNKYISADWDFIFITDKHLLDNPILLLDVLLHELAHICLKYPPDHVDFDNQIGTIQILYKQLFDQSFKNTERQIDLFKAVFLFSPYDQFVRDLWMHPLDLRFFAKRYNTSLLMAAQMLLITYPEPLHFISYDTSKKEVSIRYIPRDYSDTMGNLLSNNSWLLEDTALSKAIQSLKDAQCTKEVNGISFHCRAFYEASEENIYVIGMDGARLQMIEVRSSMKI